MRSVRLPEDIDKELENLANQKKVSRSEIIKEALVEYMAQEKKYNQPFESGSRYFGKHGSGEKDRSASYKSRIKDKIRDKHSD
ncbi:MAG: CopG family transcriptional regulator [Balneola sp.]|jgi:Arc/MetJ-type ribon-helix-helix transcriptional regulator|nr:CopG family transcriptional regulator [Balneola sp.]MBE78821.1 CopG family transcriptional regulator [Balneola sp.]|tara:strand:+ start:673 stop:921 length:249 start_codon:yes stop_codon:yes gene_type:complete